MIIFDASADFETNLSKALAELNDKDIADIIEKYANEVIFLSESSSNQTRMKIVNEFETLIQKRITQIGEK